MRNKDFLPLPLHLAVMQGLRSCHPSAQRFYALNGADGLQIHCQLGDGSKSEGLHSHLRYSNILKLNLEPKCRILGVVFNQTQKNQVCPTNSIRVLT